MKGYPLRLKARRAVRLARELYSLLNDIRAYLRSERPTTVEATIVNAAFEVAGAVYGMLLDVEARVGLGRVKPGWGAASAKAKETRE